MMYFINDYFLVLIKYLSVSPDLIEYNNLLVSWEFLCFVQHVQRAVLPSRPLTKQKVKVKFICYLKHEQQRFIRYKHEATAECLIVTYLLRPRESSVFCGPETAVVAQGEAEGNNGGRGATKHTAFPRSQ